MSKFMLNGIEYGGGGSGDGNANIQQLTFAEYNDLTDDEKKNGTVYFVCDEPGDEVTKSGTFITGSTDYAKVEIDCGFKPTYVKVILPFSNGDTTAIYDEEISTTTSTWEIPMESNKYTITLGSETGESGISDILDSGFKFRCHAGNTRNVQCTYEAKGINDAGAAVIYYMGQVYPDAAALPFSGATAESDGIQGMVPAPLKGDQDKFLKGDGTWGEVSEGSGGGGDVEANPSGTPTDTLNTIGIGDTIYDIAGSGGGGSGDAYEETNLYTATSGKAGDISLSDSILNYDLIVVYPDWDYTLTYQHRNSAMVFTKDEIAELAGGSNYMIIIQDSSHICRYSISQDGKTLTFISNNGALNARIIKGLKFKGGGGFAGSGYESEKIFDGNVTTSGNITLNSSISNYDELLFVLNYTGVLADSYIHPFKVDVSTFKNIDDYSAMRGVLLNDWARESRYALVRYYDDTTIDIQQISGVSIIEIYGIKYGAGGSSGGGVNPANYSTDEKVVGAWLDNRPVYQKTIVIDSIGESTSYSTPALDMNIDKVVDLFAIVKLGTVGGNQWITSPYMENASYRCDCHYQDSDDKIYVKSNWGATDAVVTIRYTKTTDTAGSDSWTPSEVPAVHIDENERVLGTYFGETWYERTFNLSDVVLKDNNWNNNILGTSGIFIKSYDGYFTLNNKNIFFPYSYYRGSNEYVTSCCGNNGADINVRPNMNAGETVYAGIVTIQYTKAS